MPGLQTSKFKNMFSLGKVGLSIVHPEKSILRRVLFLTSSKEFNCPKNKFSVRRYIIEYHDLTVES